MSKRGDNIHKRKDGRWEGRYKTGRLPNGSIQYTSVYGKTYREVKEKMVLISKEFEKPSVLMGAEKTFGEILNLWMANNRIRLKGGTIQKYQNLIDTHIMPELGMVKITELNATRINLFLEQKLLSGRVDKTGGLSPSYVRSITLVINAALKYAVAEQCCHPLKSPVYKPVVPKAEFVILTKNEQCKLESNLLNNMDFTNAGIFISLHTGLRIGELCALSWDDIDIENRVIHVRHTVARINNTSPNGKKITMLIIDTPKTKSSCRDVPISSVLLPQLLRLRSISNRGFLLTGTDDFLNPRTLEYRFHRVLENSNISSINFHVLRHTFATRCIEVGVDVKSLSEILGHANVGITLNTYVHSSMEMKRSQLEKLTDLFGQAT